MTGKQEMFSIAAVYKMIELGQLRVPPYQRQFVWDYRQQSALITSILRGLYVGHVILARTQNPLCYDIFDGQQRLMTIYTFIKNGFRTEETANSLDSMLQKQFLDYMLPVYILDQPDDNTEAAALFRLFNTSGEPYTAQELRRSHGRGSFAQAVHQAAAALSVPVACGEDADAVGIWTRLGLFTKQELCKGRDEVLIARLLLSILHRRCLPRDDALLDQLYASQGTSNEETERLLSHYPLSKLLSEIQNTFAVFDASLPGYTRGISEEGFYILFSALHEVLFRQNRTLADAAPLKTVFDALEPLLPSHRMDARQYAGLREYAMFQLDRLCIVHAAEDPGEQADFEAILRRAKVETAGYEFKQGLLRLDGSRREDPGLRSQLLETLCGMANLHLPEPSCLYIGIADKEADALRIAQLDGISPLNVAGHYIVGIGRETEILHISIEDYCKRLQDLIDRSSLSRPLALSLLTNISVFSYKGFSMIRIAVPPQKEVSYLGSQIFIRKHSSTLLVSDAREIVAIANHFAH